jgi:hypothetical protein
MRLRRILTTVLICSYLSALTWGVCAHVMKAGLQGNTLSYFVVWDMFCGWQAFDNRTPIIAEGASGQFYDLRAPWGEFTPFGNVPRIHYDVTNHLAAKHVRNVLTHTTHEPIDHVYVIQEIWPKQFNMPDRLWEQFFEEPKDVVKYYNLRAVLNSQGATLRSWPDWYEKQTLLSIADNPRLKRASQQAQPFYNTFIQPTRQVGRTASTFQSEADTGVYSGGSGLNTN